MTQSADGEDFEAFWKAKRRKGSQLRKVFGADVVLPPSLPLQFEVEARKVQTSKDPEDTKRMVGILFGADAMDIWTAAGMDLDQFAVLLMWGTANTRKAGSMTLDDAYQAYLKGTEEGAADGDSSGDDPAGPTPLRTATGKAGRTTARKPSGARSSATGARSKRTSAASTA